MAARTKAERVRIARKAGKASAKKKRSKKRKAKRKRKARGLFGF